MRHHGNVYLEKLHLINFVLLVTELQCCCNPQLMKNKTISNIVTDAVPIRTVVEIKKKIDSQHETVKNLTILLDSLLLSKKRIYMCLIGNWNGKRTKQLKKLRANQRKLFQKADFSDKHDCNQVLMIVHKKLQSKKLC